LAENSLHFRNMKISGFSMCRNAVKFCYPVKESILSLLPLVDEMVIAVGEGSDSTLDLVSSMGIEKMKIVETTWDIDTFANGTIHAQQTDFAKDMCTGDWLIYLQADEVLHEKDYELIRSHCERELHNLEVDGFLLNYLHFWGDFQHLQNSHSWYKHEIRIVRNDPEIHSWQSAQSFRRIKNFDGQSYRQKRGTTKLRVKAIDAAVYHYGWVRPREVMIAKMNELDRIHSHHSARFSGAMDYGDLDALPRFNLQHPAVMTEWIKLFNEQATKEGQKFESRVVMRHMRWSERILTWIETHLFRGKRLMGYKNYTLLR